MKSAKSRGRPRSFDSQKALDAAMRVFWQKGFEGASLTALTRAMKINRPSLYAAFGDKQELFRKALARYAEGPTAYVRQALNQATARAVAEHLLRGAARALSDPRNPRGCLAIQGALVCGEASEPAREALISFRNTSKDLIGQRFRRAKLEGDLPPGCNASDLARYIATVMRGMSVDAASGATPEELRRVARTAMSAWPK
jgi:AcrR family transcriptional regulator